jgi:glycosyltransferase involved in cell wall biosynthesis
MCGLSIRAVELARRLRGFGHTISFVVDREKTDVAAGHCQGMPVRRLSVRKARVFHWSLQAVARRRAAERIVGQLGFGHDLMVSCQPEVVAAYATLREGEPLVYVCGGTTLLHDMADRARQATRPAISRLAFAIDRRLKSHNESRAFARADLVVVDSLHTRDLVANTHGVDSARLHAVHGGLDEGHFQPADEEIRRQSRRRLGLRPDAVVVVWTGRLSPEKNLELLLRSVPHCERLPDRLVIVGDGPARPFLTRLAESLGLGRIVQFAGVQDDVRPFLHAADVFAFPSRGESFGGALVEAMACGLACVALRSDGKLVQNANGEIIEHGRCGLLVDGAGPEAFASALDQVNGDAALRCRLGEAARRRVCGSFTWAAGASHLNALISDLAPRRGRSHAAAESMESRTDMALEPVQ